MSKDLVTQTATEVLPVATETAKKGLEEVVKRAAEANPNFIVGAAAAAALGTLAVTGFVATKVKKISVGTKGIDIDMK